jgi:hypothetical protein
MMVRELRANRGQQARLASVEAALARVCEAVDAPPQRKTSASRLPPLDEPSRAHGAGASAREQPASGGPGSNGNETKVCTMKDSLVVQPFESSAQSEERITVVCT